eukprot:s1922_g9.t1
MVSLLSHLPPRRPYQGLDFVEIIRPLVVFTRCSARSTANARGGHCLSLTPPLIQGLRDQVDRPWRYARTSVINGVSVKVLFQPSKNGSFADAKKIQKVSLPTSADICSMGSCAFS